MAEKYILMGSETEKIRGIAMFDEITETNVIERRKAELCSKITSVLIDVEQIEHLEFVQVED